MYVQKIAKDNKKIDQVLETKTRNIRGKDSEILPRALSLSVSTL